MSPLPDFAKTEAFLVSLENLGDASWRTLEPPRALDEGEILAGVEEFGFTANNITYGRSAGMFGYWKFFPAEEGFGIIPVWGIAKVLQSKAAGIAAGEQIYGFLPMANRVILRPEAIKGLRFRDGSAHRAALPPTYNEYFLTGRDPEFDTARKDLFLILRPLFSLSFFCAEYLKANSFFGARQILISSASSRASLGLAFLLDGAGMRELDIVGLTSLANRDFVSANGRYTRVYEYEDLSSIDNRQRTIFVDVAGDAAISSSVSSRLGGSLIKTVGVGLTHPGAAPAVGLDDPAREFFFTPDHIIRLRQQWGAGLLKEKLTGSWKAFTDYASNWLKIEHLTGNAAIERVYRDVLAGKAAPDRAAILAFD